MSEVVKDEEVVKQLGWNWSDNQKRLVRGNIRPLCLYDSIRRMSVLHSDIAFVGTDGKIHLVEENIKSDYNEWNW